MKKTIIITGAAGNLGKAVVEQLDEEGYTMEATIRSTIPDHLKGRNIHCEPLDLLNEQTSRNYVMNQVEKHGEIAAAVLLVGGFAMGGIKDMDSAALDRMISINFKSAFHIVRPLMEQFEKQINGGQFIFIGAKPALEPKTGTGTVAYTLSKSLIFKLSELINETGKGKQITSSVIVPSIIDTPVNRSASPGADFSTWVDPKQIASVISFVLSDPGKQIQEPVLKVYGNSSLNQAV